MSMAGALTQRVRALGAHFNESILLQTRDIYRGQIDPTPCAEEHDVAYGDHACQKLDLFRPASAAIGVLIFIHGGGFVSGDKNEDGIFYANIGRFFASNGYITVVANYRLAPEFKWPAAAYDVRDAVEWVRKNCFVNLRKDIPLFILGQSAGACHVASWLFDGTTREAPLGSVNGVLLMSGFYRADPGISANAAAYFGTDDSRYPARSPLTHVTECAIPIWLSVAEFDPGPMAARTFELAQALSAANVKSPQVHWFSGHNHVSTVMSLGSPQLEVGEAILAFMASVT